MAPCTVEELWRFPVKSMGGERLDYLEFGADGVVGDRRFAERNLETGLIASAKRPGRWGMLLSCRAVTDADGVSVTLPDGSAFRTTMRYDRARRSLDRHATYIVSTFIAGATRPA